MKKILLIGAILLGCVSAVHATTYLEDFNAPFPAWESGWLGTNSNLTNYYVTSSGTAHDFRGNNPDGLWIGGQQIIFNSSFGASLTSFSIDIAGYTPVALKVKDSLGNVILNQDVALTFGAFTNPGVYSSYSVQSTTGISEFDFIGDFVLGNTSIDNVQVTDGGGNPVPEPATMLLFGAGIAGLAAVGRRKRS